jgi:hypothetical protein
LRSEQNPKAAEKRARRNERFWRMTFCMGGISYTELKEMDLFEFTEAEQARLLWQNEWNKKS